jgi:hypothetical protein
LRRAAGASPLFYAAAVSGVPFFVEVSAVRRDALEA